MKKYSKKEVLKIIIATAKDYQKILENMNYIFVYRDRNTNKIEYFETVFLARHFQHLCGVDYINANTGEVLHNSADFYHRAVKNELSEKEIKMRDDGTTNLKLEALPKLVTFIHFSKMTVLYNGIRPKLNVDRLAGTTSYCLGFTKERKYYMPSSCLLEDIRDLGTNPSQILFVLSKDNTANNLIYRKIRYVAKGVSPNKINLPDELYKLIDLSDFQEK